MRPIPRSMLPHTVMLHRIIEKDSWGKGQLDAGTELRWVKIEPSGRIVRDKNNAEIQLAATLFYDCKNSRPKDMTFCVDDIIVFHGQKHRVQTVEAMYGSRDQPHHYELGLIKYA